MKFLINDMQVITLKGDQKKAREFFKKSLKRKDTKKTPKEMDYEPRTKIQSEVMLIELDCREDIKKGT